MTSESKPVQARLYIVSAYDDRRFRDALMKQLSALQRIELIDNWHAYEPPLSSEWTKQNEARLNQADIILLLVSPDFIASDYCGKQMQRAMERRATGDAYVVPILIRPAQWQTPPLANLQWLPRGNPEELEAVSTWKNRDEAYDNIVKEIKRLIEKPPIALPTEPEAQHREEVHTPPPNTKETRKNTREPQTPAQGTCYFVYNMHTSWVGSVVWSPDGTRIASGGGEGAVRVWDAKTGDTRLNYKGHVGLASNVWSVTWSPDSSLLASAGTKSEVQVWRVANGQKIAAYKGHAPFLPIVANIAWSPDGKYVASTSLSLRDKIVHIWLPKGGLSVAKLHLNTSLIGTDPIGAVAWSPDSTRVACGLHGEVRVYDVQTKRELQTYRSPSAGVFYRACWSRDNRMLVCSSPKQAVVWDMHTGNILTTYIGHKADVRDIALSPDGQYVASASNDRTVHIWKAETGQHIYTYPGHTDEVASVTWSPDGTRIASACKDGTVHVWQAI